MDTATPAQLKRIAELEDALETAREEYYETYENADFVSLPDAVHKLSKANDAFNEYLRSVYPG